MRARELVKPSELGVSLEDEQVQKASGSSFCCHEFPLTKTNNLPLNCMGACPSAALRQPEERGEEDPARHQRRARWVTFGATIWCPAEAGTHCQARLISAAMNRTLGEVQVLDRLLQSLVDALGYF
jgi:hypothetical protein